VSRTWSRSQYCSVLCARTRLQHIAAPSLVKFVCIPDGVSCSLGAGVLIGLRPRMLFRDTVHGCYSALRCLTANVNDA
jgi:hypothetical protein